jgi:hypothetical protein
MDYTQRSNGNVSLLRERIEGKEEMSLSVIEFYIQDTFEMVTSVNGSAVPRQGELINIRKITYQVARVTWCVDHANKIIGRRQLRANVELTPIGDDDA